MSTCSGEWLLYLRKSKGRAGIGRQRAITTAHIEQRGGTILAEFTDTDRTAFAKAGAQRPDREGFDAMIATLRARPGVGVAAWHADRLTRNDEDTQTLLAVCRAGHHLIETPRGGTYDLSTANGRKRLRDDASDAIYEVDNNRERILAKKAEAKTAGLWLGGSRPFGWEILPRLDKDEEPPALRLIPAEAALVRDGTRAILSGESLRSVTKAWNESGITGSRGAAWANREVSTVLRRARNAGLAEHDLDGHGLAVTGPGQWAPIVSEEEWRACKAILEDPGRRTAFSTQPSHLLSGIAACGVCGTPVVATGTNRGPGRPKQATYLDRPKMGKGHVARQVAALDHHISELAIGWLERYGQEALNPPAPDTTLPARLLAAVEADLRALDDAAEDESISTAQFIRRSRRLNQRAKDLRQQIAGAAVARIPALVFTADDIRGGWEAASLDARRALIRALMTITILPSPRGRPPGYRKGDGGYFRPETIRIEWKREE